MLKKILIALALISVALAVTLIVAAVTRPSGKGYWRHAYDTWMGFALILQTVILSTVLGVLYLLIVPIFWLLFLRRHDLLGRRLEGSTFWHDSPDVDFSLKRTYKLY